MLNNNIYGNTKNDTNIYKIICNNNDNIKSEFYKICDNNFNKYKKYINNNKYNTKYFI
jgi:hypothetical protein